MNKWSDSNNAYRLIQCVYPCCTVGRFKVVNHNSTTITVEVWFVYTIYKTNLLHHQTATAFNWQSRNWQFSMLARLRVIIFNSFNCAHKTKGFRPRFDTVTVSSSFSRLFPKDGKLIHGQIRGASSFEWIRILAVTEKSSSLPDSLRSSVSPPSGVEGEIKNLLGGVRGLRNIYFFNLN